VARVTRGQDREEGALGQVDAIVVLGCALRDGAASPALIRRVQCGAALLRRGLAPLLVLSGGGTGRSEAEAMRDIALAEGAPAAALLLESASRNTFENARETALLLRRRGLRRILLVSDRYHLPRAGLLFRAAGLDVAGRIHPSGGMKREWLLYLREAAALPLSLWRLWRARAVASPQ